MHGKATNNEGPDHSLYSEPTGRLSPYCGRCGGAHPGSDCEVTGPADLMGTLDELRVEALLEFNAAARAAHRAQRDAQAAAVRYAAAVKRLSDLAVQEE